MEKPKPQSPLLGYNTNVRHLGVVYHIQTEDSGIEHPHIITHLFVEGTILSTKKTSYKEHVGSAEYEETVRGMMRDQHKAMFIELRDGVHDPISYQIFGDKLDPPPPGEPQTPAPEVQPAPAPQAPAPAVQPAPAPHVPAPQVPPVAAQAPKSAGEAGVPQKSVRVVRPAAMDEKTQPEPELKISPGEQVGRSIFDTPDEDGEFGESLVSDKSLDEVILSYLTDELDE